MLKEIQVQEKQTQRCKSSLMKEEKKKKNASKQAKKKKKKGEMMVSSTDAAKQMCSYLSYLQSILYMYNTCKAKLYCKCNLWCLRFAPVSRGVLTE